MREVIAGTGVQPHPLAVLAGDDPEPIVLDLVQPLAAGGQFIGFGWKARRDEPGREDTLQHVRLISRSNDYCNSTMIVSAMTRQPWRVCGRPRPAGPKTAGRGALPRPPPPFPMLP